MLDENLPTFRFKLNEFNPLSTVVYFAQNGNEPTAAYVLRRPDPTMPVAHNKYAVALEDPYSADVVYAESVVQPEWAQVSLSPAEQHRVQQQNGGGGLASAPATPTKPEVFTMQLYNPDQTVAVRMSPWGWNRSESWEFELPTQTFKRPSASQLDRAQSSGRSSAEADLMPKIVFRWKRDGRLSRDMTCFLTGTKLGGGRKNKEPDITIALFKAGKSLVAESSVTVYESNLQRVEVEDGKGLELVLLLSAQIARDLWLIPRPDPFNLSGTRPGSGKTKDSRPPPPVAAQASLTMSGALYNGNPASAISPTFAVPTSIPPPSSAPLAAAAAVDAETQRLQRIFEHEERALKEQQRRAKAECEKHSKAEEKQIRKMLEDEERERRKKEVEVAEETERLRKMYGTQGQDLPSTSSPPSPLEHDSGGRSGHQYQGAHSLPQRPVSVGPLGSGMTEPFIGGGWCQDGGGPSQPHMQLPNQGWFTP